MKPPAPIDVRPLFAPLGVELVALLRGLDAAAFARPATPRWAVRDVAAHLLETALRRLSMHRDGVFPPPPPEMPQDFAEWVRFLDGLNAQWTRTAQAFSPRLLTELLAAVEPPLSAFLSEVPLDAPAFFAVDWAGVDGKAMWLDVGREYTERWHHQQQIRDALGAPALAEPRWTGPVLAVAARALPRAWRDVAAPEGTRVVVRLSSATWTLRRGSQDWMLLVGEEPGADAVVASDDETAWRAWHKLVPREPRVATEGDPALTAPFPAVRALMA